MRLSSVTCVKLTRPCVCTRPAPPQAALEPASAAQIRQLRVQLMHQDREAKREGENTRFCMSWINDITHHTKLVPQN